MLEGKITLSSDLAQIVRDDGVVLADGAVVLDAGHQSLAGDHLISSLVFVGDLTDAGRERVQA